MAVGYAERYAELATEYDSGTLRLMTGRHGKTYMAILDVLFPVHTDSLSKEQVVTGVRTAFRELADAGYGDALPHEDGRALAPEQIVGRLCGTYRWLQTYRDRQTGVTMCQLTPEALRAYASVEALTTASASANGSRLQLIVQSIDETLTMVDPDNEKTGEILRRRYEQAKEDYERYLAGDRAPATTETVVNSIGNAVDLMSSMPPTLQQLASQERDRARELTNEIASGTVSPGTIIERYLTSNVAVLTETEEGNSYLDLLAFLHDKTSLGTILNEVYEIERYTSELPGADEAGGRLLREWKQVFKGIDNVQAVHSEAMRTLRGAVSRGRDPRQREIDQALAALHRAAVAWATDGPGGTVVPPADIERTEAASANADWWVPPEGYDAEPPLVVGESETADAELIGDLRRGGAKPGPLAEAVREHAVMLPDGRIDVAKTYDALTPGLRRLVDAVGLTWLLLRQGAETDGEAVWRTAADGQEDRYWNGPRPVATMEQIDAVIDSERRRKGKAWA